MRIRIRGSGECVPVCGMLRSGALVFDPEDGSFRTVTAADFEVVAGEKSAFWIESVGETAFAEFFERYFMENLANGAPRERFIAKSCLELFDREFPRDELETPKYYGDGLASCPKCGKIFRPLSFLGVIRCTDRDCRLLMNNPFYDPDRLKESIEWGRLGHLSECREQYYCTKTQRYYPAPPSRAALLAERLSERFREWRRRLRDRKRRKK